jgi:YD repeat-containing protein
METDYVGAPNTHLELRRYYNSQDTSISGFGTKWHSTYHRGLTQPNSTTVAVTRADGHVDTFTLSSGVWNSNPDVISKLTAITDGGGTQTGWKLVTSDADSEIYSLDGRLLSITTRAGLVTQLTYDANNKLIQVAGPFGHTLSFAFDGQGRVAHVTLPDGSVYLYEYDDSNNLVKVAYNSSISKLYAYNTFSSFFGNSLTEIVDENGNTFAVFAYDTDGHGRALSTTHAGGADQTTLAYNTDGTVTATDARGNAHTYTFTTQFGKVKPTTISGTPCLTCGGKAFTYDANGFIASRTDFNGNITKYVHNTRGLETSRTEAFGTPQARTITTVWHQIYRLPTKITEPNRITSFAYDAKGNLTKKSITAGTQTRSWSYKYNSYGQVTWANGPRTDVNDITKYAYDTQGNLISITDALGQITKITSYDGNGRPLTIVDPNGLTISLTYDFKGRITSRNIGGELTQYTYDNVGNLLKVTQPDGSYTAYTYDPAHRLTQISDSLGNKIAYTLDASGNPTKEQVYDPLGVLVRSHSREFDALNRLAKSIDAQGQAVSFVHDDNGNLTSTTDPLAHTSTQSYDALNRLIASIDPAANKTQYQYDANDNPVKVTDPRGAITSYAYDGLDDITHLLSPDTGATQNSYDPAGNLLSSTDARGKTTSYTYDALNRVKSITFASGTPITFTYDKAANARGRLIGITDETGSTSWTYDIHGRVTRHIQIIDAIKKITYYSYDIYGRLANTTYPSRKYLRKINIIFNPNLGEHII